MTTRLSKANLRKFASLSALGAGGTIGLTAGTIDTSAIVYSGVVDEKVGYAAGFGSHATIAGPGGADARLFKFTSRLSFSFGKVTYRDVLASADKGAHGTTVKILGDDGQLLAYPRGSKFGTPASSRLFNEGWVADSHLSYFDSTDRYLLFEFTGGDLPHPIYGWAQLNVYLPCRTVCDTGPDVTLISYAYDLSGVQIPAGYHGPAKGPNDSAAPEPSTSAVTSLAALALGAAGLRRWRAARRAS
jgi:hypothetical protein